MTRRIYICLLAFGIFAVSSLASAQQPPMYPYKTGKDIYEHVCQACHMPDAKGAVGAGAYPALAGNPKLAASTYPVVVILRGLKSMPAFSDLDDAQVVALANYIRTNFGNNYTDVVTLAQVKELRPEAVTRRRGRAG